VVVEGEGGEHGLPVYHKNVSIKKPGLETIKQ
jgi:hypothetical protein